MLFITHIVPFPCIPSYSMTFFLFTIPFIQHHFNSPFSSGRVTVTTHVWIIDLFMLENSQICLAGVSGTVVGRSVAGALDSGLAYKSVASKTAQVPMKNKLKNKSFINKFISHDREIGQTTVNQTICLVPFQKLTAVYCSISLSQLLSRSACSNKNNGYTENNF